MKADITLGDLVAVDGYPDRIFFVEARRKVEEEDDTGVSNYVEFDLADAIHGEWILADSNDIRLVCRSQFVDEYLDGVDYENYPEPEGTAFHFAEFLPELPYADTMAKLSEELEKAWDDMAKKKTEKIDELLDELNDYKRLEAMYGDEEYKAKQVEEKAKLKREVER
ncbi:hypothetical protein [Bacillus licheniformis]|uniref:hypothetical protein n=1 Tax=Bacillus licheniformis TaxID=1402 RepID=UPI0009278EE9|nr:hypothetical protein [Bacillus licheniformis]OJT54201.1 hypothetical protein BFP47_23050 [Bacillus licheniformis]OJT66627.1 hypothetical protein BFP46_24195 [Bacillus licheniformis]